MWRGAWRERAPIVDGAWSFSLQASYSFLDRMCQHHQHFQLPQEGHHTSVSHSLGVDSKNQIEELSKQVFVELIVSFTPFHTLCLLHGLQLVRDPS